MEKTKTCRRGLKRLLAFLLSALCLLGLLPMSAFAMEPGQTLADVMAFRAPLYEQYADLIVDCPAGQPLAQTAQDTLERLRRAGLVPERG